MVLSWIWTAILAISLIFSIYSGHGSELSASVIRGAQQGITLAISMAGSICLWSAVGKLMDRAGLTTILSKLLRPLLRKIFPGTQKNPPLAKALSANICANFLGLGNAATPMGIQAVKLMADPKFPKRATDEMCRLVVLNTASIQLIPANVAAVRASLGCQTPFDILPAVWIASLCSAEMGLIAAWAMGKVRKYD